jgi:CYTH domain-containing protein
MTYDLQLTTNFETERKFLVTDMSFLGEAFRSQHIVQGYICADAERSVRVRICGDNGFLTIKSASDERGWSRYEFEQQVALEEAAELMKLCLPGRIDKVRHYVRVGDRVWEVDVFSGANEGLIVAEIELESVAAVFERPSWVGEEVSGDTKYYNMMLSQYPYSEWTPSEKKSR